MLARANELSNLARYTDKLVDYSGNANHGELVGGVTVAQDGGPMSRSYSFDGTDGCVDVDDDASLELSGDFTIEAWICRTNGIR